MQQITVKGIEKFHKCSLTESMPTQRVRKSVGLQLTGSGSTNQVYCTNIEFAAVVRIIVLGKLPVLLQTFVYHVHPLIN